MTKVLEIYGEDDYAVISFEDAKRDGLIDENQLWNKSHDSGDQAIEFEDEANDYYFTYKAHEFGEVDQSFVDFVMNEVCDYDALKHHGFVIVKEVS